MCAQLKRTKKKSGGFGVKRLTDKWRDRTYSVKLFYYELDNYFIENENQDLREEKRQLKVEVFNDDTEQYETFDLIDKDHMPPSGSDYSDLTDAQVNDIKY